MLMMRESARDWAMKEFGGVKLADPRWRARLIKMAARSVLQPNGKVSEVFCDAAERQGAYGLLECRDVEPAQLGMAMFAATARRCADENLVFAAVDGSSLTLADDAHEKGFGYIGARKFGARGMKVINALAVSPAGVTLGLLSQVWWARTGKAVKQRHKMLAPNKKETRHWLKAMEHSRQQIAEHAPKTRIWFQLDREADGWAILNQADDEGHWFTVRGNHNRRVRQPDGSITSLRKVLSAQGVSCCYQLPVRAGPGRSARTTSMLVRAARVTLDMKDKATDLHVPKTLNAVLAREQTPPPGQKAIEWILLTNRSVETTEDLAQIIYGYSLRWRIEDFHRTWKSGACNVEQMQLRSVSAAIKWATLLAAVAVRIERIKLLSREQPQLPATSEFSRVELRAIVILRFGKKPPAGSDAPTLEKATQWLAEIGGYTGKSSGGPPGSVTLARGFAQMQAAVRTLQALEPSSD